MTDENHTYGTAIEEIIRLNNKVLELRGLRKATPDEVAAITKRHMNMSYEAVIKSLQHERKFFDDHLLGIL